MWPLLAVSRDGGFCFSQRVFHGKTDDMAKDWRVGVLFSREGVTSAVENTMANATRLAIDEINAAGGMLGRPIVAVEYDPLSSPKLSRELATRLLLEDGVKNIFGCYMSSCRKAVLPEIEAYRGLLFYPTFYEGFEYSPRCFYTGTASNQSAIQLARYLMDNYGSRFLLVGSNYVFPYEYNRIVTDLVTQSKGKILDEIYVPIDAKIGDFRRPLKLIERLKPDAIISTLVGTGVTLFYEAFADAGYDAARMPIAAITTSEAEIATMKPGTAKGHIASTAFFETLQTPAAQRFVSAYKARFGNDAPVTACAEAAYFQMHLYANAVAAAGTDEPDEIASALGGLEFDAPQGTVRIDPSNHHTELWPRIGKVNAEGKFDIVWESPHRVRPDPYFVIPSNDAWTEQRHVLNV